MRVLSVNVGTIREIQLKKRVIETGIFKEPTDARVAVSALGLAGDVRVLPRKMGEEHHAVYAYPHEHYGYWERELGREPFPMGQFGENLTVTGLLEEEVRIGDVFRFGNTTLQIAQPRIPCGRLNERMGLRFAPVFLASRKVGYYMRVIEPGDVGQGDSIELLERDPSSPTMDEFVRILQYDYWDAEGLRHILGAKDLMPAWREIAERKLEQAESTEGWHGLRELVIVARDIENDGVVSLSVECRHGKALAPFKAGQRLVVVLGGRGFSGDQRRRAYAISSSPRDLSRYRITVRAMDPAWEQSSGFGTMSSHLLSLAPGDSVWCTTPHGPFSTDGLDSDRIPVLISQGIGVAPMLSILAELAESGVPEVYLFHERSRWDPERLLAEASSLAGSAEGFQFFADRPRDPDAGALGEAFAEVASVNAGAIAAQLPVERADFYVAGSAEFVYRVITELVGIGVQSNRIRAERFN